MVPRDAQFAHALAKVKPLLDSDAALTVLSQSDLVQALNIAAVCSLGLMKPDDAELYWRRLIDVQPEFTDAYKSLGILFRGLNRLQDAEAIYRRMLSVCPDHAEGLNNFGTVLFDLNRLPEAEAAYRAALTTRADFAEASHNLGKVLHAANRFGEAEEAYRKALQLEPNKVEIHIHLGNTLERLGRLAEADDAYQAALAVRFDVPEAHHNRAIVLKTLGRLPESEASYRRALAFRPDFPIARFSLASLLLSVGRYEEGWPLYEARYEQPGRIHHHSAAVLQCARWRGEPLAGKTLLVWQEDGLGDMIQFGRYLPVLKAQGVTRITLACAASLHRMFAGIDCVDEVTSHGEAALRSSTYDTWTSLTSVPAYLRTTLSTIPPALRLTPDPALVQHWAERLASLPRGRKIGVVWKGNPKHHNDANRSLPSLAALAPLWSVPGLSFVSLQKGQGEDDANAPPVGQPLLHLGSDVKDFADTCAIVAQLDLLVCVDTSSAHLAASLGKRCWMLLPGHDADWRWMRERTDSPWYPESLRLFRQARGEHWDAVIERVRDALSALEF
ncbi:Flp pilus assembly protein TadD [Paraburkholderia rhizosphaerae]|uniref:Flp pilus assembly protein TadD n=2 Tax=Paraburkholderia rhizosphaerae TaxID=480658 RepID=A0A4R8L7V2_9BURK|nr:Flp pilus assembly protein TadD [Paraburkholderia rhizosphaerae]